MIFLMNNESLGAGLVPLAGLETGRVKVVSDRPLDAFDNPAKTACRRDNLRVLREAAFSLWEDDGRTRLRCDWCELMGATGWLTLDLLESEGILTPGGFVGIDLDTARIEGYQQRRPDLKWVAGNLYTSLEAMELVNVGVLNLDAYHAVGSADAMADFRLVRGLALRSLERFGEFALFLNADLDAVVRQGLRPGPSLRHHAALVSRTFEGCLQRRRLTPEMLLPPGSEDEIDSGFVGTLGAFEIYRGTDRGHRMANLRVILR